RLGDRGRARRRRARLRDPVPARAGRPADGERRDVQHPAEPRARDRRDDRAPRARPGARARRGRRDRLRRPRLGRSRAPGGGMSECGREPPAADRGAYAAAEVRPFWLATLPAREPEPPVTGVVEADLCIVGGGFTGLWAALHAKADDPARDVAVLEAD